MKGSAAGTSPTSGSHDLRQEARTYKDIRQDYVFDPDPFNGEPDRVRRVKEIVATELTEVERTIFLLYTDCLSYRKLGRRLGLSHMTVRREVLRIRQKIIDIYNVRSI